jgi:hypothetical protein
MQLDGRTREAQPIEIFLLLLFRGGCHRVDQSTRLSYD